MKMTIRQAQNYRHNVLASKRLSRRQLFVESLEERALMAVDISFSDATVVEGADNAHFVDIPISSATSPLDGPKAIAKGPNGDIFVTSAVNNSVLRYDGNTFQYLGVFVNSGSGGLSNPIDLEFAGGNLLVSSGITNSVLKYDGNSGAYLGEFVPANANGIVRPTDLLEHNGFLYISAWSGDVHRYNISSGSFVDKFVTGLNTPVGIDFGPDGNFYVGEYAEFGNNAIYRYDGVSGNYIGEFVSDGAGGLNRPAGIEFGPDGSLYVVSGLNGDNRVLRFNGNSGMYLNDFVSVGLGGINGPTRILFSDNQLLVTSQDSDQIMRYSAPWAVFTISLNSPSAEPVSVSFSTESGSATSDLDFIRTTGVVTFVPGETERKVLVKLKEDSIVEGNESFLVTLSNPLGGIIVDGQGIGTIIDLPTKFYVVNDGGPDRTYEYGAAGEVIENYSMNSGNTTPRGAASNVSGNRVWVVDNNRRVYVYDTSGGLLGSWSAGTLATNASVQGIATNGTDVWIVDSQSDKVYKYAGAASRLSGSQNAVSFSLNGSFSLNNGNKEASDLVTDGTSFWVLNNTSSTDKVFKYSLSGSLLGSWTISTPGVSSPTGITLNPAGPSELWIVDNGTDRVYQYNAAVGVTSGSRSASSSFALAAGNTNPQGIADPPPPSNSVRMPSAVMAPPTANALMTPMANSKASDIAFSQFSRDVVLIRASKPFERDRADSEPSLAPPQSRNSVIAFSTQKSLQTATSENQATSLAKRLTGTTEDIFSNWNTDVLKDFDLSQLLCIGRLQTATVDINSLSRRDQRPTAHFTSSQLVKD